MDRYQPDIHFHDPIAGNWRGIAIALLCELTLGLASLLAVAVLIAMIVAPLLLALWPASPGREFLPWQ